MVQNSPSGCNIHNTIAKCGFNLASEESV